MVINDFDQSAVMLGLFELLLIFSTENVHATDKVAKIINLKFWKDVLPCYKKIQDQHVADCKIALSTLKLIRWIS